MPGSKTNHLWLQTTLKLPPLRRGFHLITERVVQALPSMLDVQVGLLHLFVQHTSASLMINENADPDVQADLESSLSSIVPEDFPYQHTVEGPDDMPAHIKAALIGCAVSVPISDGRLALGVWQGIYLCEHRNRASGRSIVLTLQGQCRA